MPSGLNPKVDHSSHRDRHDQGRNRGDGQRDQGKNRASAVTRHIGRQRQQRTQPRAAPARQRRQFGFDKGRR